MQFNAVYTRSGYSRPSDERHLQKHQRKQPEAQKAQPQKHYMRCATLSPAPLWIISSLQTHLQTQIMFRSKRCAVSESVITRNSFMRRFTTARTSHPLLSICNTLTGEMPYNSTQRMHVPFPSFTPFASLRNRYDGGSVHSVQPPAQRQDRSYSITAEALARGADCCHPYWRNHGRPPLAYHVSAAFTIGSRPVLECWR
jgi:hypothetical protein